MARYIVIEGSGNSVFFNNYRDCSEAMFWREINKVMLGERYYLVPACGNRNLYAVLSHLCNTPNTEEIILCYDWFLADSVRPYLDSVRAQFISCCIQKHIKYRVIQGYTFEWFLLSCNFLMNWAYNVDVRKSSYVYKLVKLHKAVLELSEPDKWYLSDKLLLAMRDCGVNFVETDSFERIASRILNKLTMRTGFLVTKEKLGKCWQGSCFKRVECREKQLLESKHSSSSYRPTCGLYTHNKSLKAKLQSVLESSRVKIYN